MDIQNTVALVTGGAHRIGKAITLGLAQAGANVVINYHSSAAKASITAEEAKTYGVEALAIQCDISQHAQVQAMAQQVEHTFGRLDILVNSASLWQATPFPDTDLSGWHRVTDVAIHGAYYVSNTFVPLMLTQPAGAIINIVDLSVREPWHDFTAHAVGKSALLAMTRQFALELAPTIRVNAVAPGAILPPPDYTPERIAKSAETILLERWGAVADVAHAVQFLIEADYITGELLYVDGGEHLSRYKNTTI